MEARGGGRLSNQGRGREGGERLPRRELQRHYPLPLDTRNLLTMHPTAALQHVGLALQRLIWYARPWEMNQEHQHSILGEIATQSQSPSQRPEQLADALMALHTRAEAAQQSLSEVGWKVRAFSAVVQWRLVTGLGAAGILEGAGMVLHRLYGFSYLPGSSLKGLVRQYLWLNGHANEDDPLVIQMFGSQERRGEVSFWDALPEA
jgi:uncharacterized MAPEG superfamily protein